jgi:2-C-methyl-D-erythritol 4-phosphate cytidylyltransferase
LLTPDLSSAAIRCAAIVPAAGLGRRFGGELPKQYLPLAGSSVLEQTLQLLLGVEALHTVVLVVHPDDSRWQDLALCRHPRVQIARGGAERCHSVRNGLARLDQLGIADEWVLVHDVARPCCPRADIERLLRELSAHPVGGLLAAPVTDTLKRSDADGAVAATVDRTRLWAALTPQLFRRELLRRALEESLGRGELVTDEAQAIEALGLRPQLIEGSRRNLKITRPEDLDLAGYFLAQGAC